MASRLRFAGVVLVCADVALIPLAFDHDAFGSFAMPKALLGHALGYATAAVLAALILRFRRAALVWSPLHIPVLSFLGACAVATAFAMDPYVAMFGTHERLVGLATILDWVLLYFAVVVFVRTRDDAVLVAGSAFAASLVVAGYALIQALGRDPYSWSIDGADRAFSTTGQPTALAQYAPSLGVAALSCALLLPRLGRTVRGSLLGVAAASIAATAATDSRAPVVGLAAAALVLVSVIAITRWGTRDAWVAALAGTGAVALLAVLLIFTPIGSRVAFTIQATGAGDDLYSRVDESTAGRFALYGIAVEEFLERPLVGYGPDNFVVGVPRYRQEISPPVTRQSSATSVHSWLIQTLATTGLLGTVSLLGVLATAAVLVMRSRFAPLPFALTTVLVADLGTGLTTIDDLSTGWIMWFCLGGIAAATGRPMGASSVGPVAGKRRSQRRGGTRQPAWYPIAASALVAAAVLAMVGVLPAYSASKSAYASLAARVAGRSADAVSAGLDAVGSDPRRGEYWHALGLAYVAANRFADANTALGRASELLPYLTGYTGDLIQVQLAFAQSGDANAKARGIELATQLVARDPNNPLSHYYRAQVLGVAGDVSGAIGSIERALALDPGSKNVDLYRVAAQLYLNAKRPQDAVDIARKGIAAVGPSQPLKDLRDVLDRALAALGLPPDPRPDPQACTSTRWIATPASATTGTSVSFTVQAEGCPRQESQLAIQPPTATAPSYLNGGNWTSVFVWNTRDNPPGTYRVFLYTRRQGWTGPYQAKYEADYVLR